MRILLDECVNPRVKLAFPNHDVTSVTESAWRSLKDADLLDRAQSHFDAFITIDRGFEFEHNLNRLTFGIVILHVSRNRIGDYMPLFTELLATVEAIQPGEVRHVGTYSRRQRIS